MQCSAITQNGSKCCRKVDKKYCWQHKPVISKFTFELDGATLFFKQRLKNKEMYTQLQKWTSELKNDIISEYTKIIHQILATIGYDINWNNLSLDKKDIEVLWDYREIILCLSLTTAFQISKNNKSVNIIGIKRNLILDNISATILGSKTLFSDVDVTITSDHASTFIAVVEDLWQYVGFDNIAWKVDLYGDFLTVGNYYINTNYFDNNTLMIMLEDALASYFRHSNSSTFDLSVLKYLIQWCIENKKITLDVNQLIENAKNKVSELHLASREIYYIKLKKAEALETKIKASLLFGKLTEGQLEKLVLLLSESNLYRHDNYILIPTIIHIVKIEQEKKTEAGTCDIILSQTAKCTMSSFSYILSVIEQLGYMQDKLTEAKLDCTLGAGKYFGRIVRGMKEVWKDDKLYTNLNLIMNKLDKAKNSQTADDQCETMYDLYGYIKNFTKNII